MCTNTVQRMYKQSPPQKISRPVRLHTFTQETAALRKPTWTYWGRPSRLPAWIVQWKETTVPIVQGISLMQTFNRH